MIYDEDPFRRRPRGIDGEVKSAGEVRLDGGKYGKMAFRAQLTHQNQTIGRLRRESKLNGGAI